MSTDLQQLSDQELIAEKAKEANKIAERLQPLNPRLAQCWREMATRFHACRSITEILSYEGWENRMILEAKVAFIRAEAAARQEA